MFYVSDILEARKPLKLNRPRDVLIFDSVKNPLTPAINLIDAKFIIIRKPTNKNISPINENKTDILSI